MHITERYTDSVAALCRLKSVPILAIRGAQSDILSTATFERMQREKPDLVRLEVANRGHVPLLDEPECLTAVDAFLARLDHGVNRTTT